jgi:hypothetical protein
MYGVLQLAMNCSNHDVAYAAATLLVSMQEGWSKPGWSALDAAAVSKLLMTATARQHDAAVSTLEGYLESGLQ